MAQIISRKGGSSMENYGSHSEGEFEPLGGGNKSKKKKKRFRRARKFFEKFCDRLIDTILYIISQIILNYFDRRFEKAFA